MTQIESISQLGTASVASASDIFPVTQGSTGAGTGTTVKMSIAQVSTAISGAFNVASYGAVANGQSQILNVSIASNSNVLTVSMPTAWTPTTVTAYGTVCTNNGNAYTAVIAGTTGSTGPQVGILQGNLIVDGTVSWVWIGTAPTTANVFFAADVGKVLSISRQDVYAGQNPWYNQSPLIGNVTITGYNNPTSVTLSLPAASTAPSTAGVPPLNTTQSWPYNNTPSIVSWGTDNSPSFQAALNACQTAGGAVYIPAGSFCFKTQLVIYSDTLVYGGGEASILIPCGVVTATGSANQTPNSSQICPFFVNRAAYANSYLGSFGPGTSMTRMATLGDQRIIIRDMFIDMRQAQSAEAYGQIVSRFLYINQFLAYNVTCLGSPLNPFEGFNFTACNDFKVLNCDYINVGQGLEPWDGSNSGEMSDCRLIMPYNGCPIVTNGTGPLNAIQINTVGTSAGTDGYSDTYTLNRNKIYLNGSLTQAWYSLALFLFPDSLSSVMKNIEMNDNVIICTGNYNFPVLVSGGVTNLKIQRNTIVGADGWAAAPLQFSPQNATTLSYTAITTAVNVNGQSTVVINWPAHGFGGYFNNVNAPFFYVVSGLTVGGLALNGYYPITAVTTNAITIQVGTNGTGGTVAWGGAYAQILLGTYSAEISDNRFLDCQALGNITFNTQTVNYTAGLTVTGGTSGATATIVSVVQSGGTGTLFVTKNSVANFAAAETITDTGGGSAKVVAYTLPPALMQVTGVDIQVKNNNIMLTGGAPAGNYLAHVNYSGYANMQGITNQRAGASLGNTGPAGQGAVPAGSNRTCWAAFSPIPVYIDTDDVNQLINIKKLGSTLELAAPGQGASLVVSGANSGVYPTSGFNASIAWNFLSGAELDLWNNFTTAVYTLAVVQQTGVSTNKLVMLANPTQLYVYGAYIDVSATTAVPVSGNTVTITAATSRQVISPAGAIANLTIVTPAAATLPAPAGSVQPLEIIFTQAVTGTLTWTAGAGTTYAGAALPGTVVAGAKVTLEWLPTPAQWFHVLQA